MYISNNISVTPTRCPFASALVIDENHDTARAIARVVNSLGFDTRVALTLAEARAKALHILPQIVLTDINMPDGDGVDFVDELRDLGVEDFIVISGHTDQQCAIHSLRAGVADFLSKPVRLSEIERVVKELVRVRQDRMIGKGMPASMPVVEPARLACSSDASLALKKRLESVARSKPIRAVITGAPGVGKRFIAARLHEESVGDGPLVTVSCAQEVDELARLRFFGRKACGDDQAFAGYADLAAGGTLLLDDLSALPLAMQSALRACLDAESYRPLGAVEDVPLQCAVVGILREPVDTALASGRLVDDLQHALAREFIEVPSLSQRPGDALEIAERLVRALNCSYGTEKVLSEGLRERLGNYPFPGNVLELKSMLRSAYAGTEPDEEILPDRVFMPNLINGRFDPVAPLVGQSFRDVEKDLLFATLKHTGGNKRQAARLLGISLKTLYNRLQSYH